MKTVSIVVPIYNAENYLNNTISSIIKQTYKNLEIILVDDASSDNSVKICEEYIVKDKRIKLIRNNQNQGVSYSRNKGIDIATGEYILFIDSDDTVDSNYVFELVSANKRCMYDLVVCNFNNIIVQKNTIKKRMKNIIDVSLLTGNFFNDYYYINSVLTAPWGKLYKLKIIKLNNIRFTKIVAEDYVFNMEYYRFVKKYKFINLYLYNYFHRNVVSLSKMFTVNNFKMHLKVIKKEVYFLEKYNIKNKEKILGNCLVMRCLGYMVIKGHISFKESKRRIETLKLATNNPKKCTKKRDLVVLKLINAGIYMPLYLYCLLRTYIRNKRLIN